MKIYTRQGDAGMSGLFDGRRVPKNHPRLEAFGTVDELNSLLGLAAAQCQHAALVQQLQTLQRELLTLGADLATPRGAAQEQKIQRIGPEQIARLEAWIDAATAQLPPLKRFILPGGSTTAAQLHIARTVCRRAERRVTELLQGSEPAGDQVLPYLNRLGDLLFVLARLANQLDGRADELWEPERSG